MWQFRTWFSRPGGVGLTVGLDDLRGLSNLKDSMILQNPFLHQVGGAQHLDRDGFGVGGLLPHH